MNQEKVVFFLDYANINRAAREQRYRLNYQHLLNYIGEARFLVEAYCYIPINPRNEHRLDGVIEELWLAGYLVTSKRGTLAGGTYKCNFDVEIAIDLLKAVYQLKPDIIVLATGDADFVPLILEARKCGVRVEVAAFTETIGSDILSKCSGFIDLTIYYESYLAAQNGAPGEDSETELYQDLIRAQNDVRTDDNGTKSADDLVPAYRDEPKEEELAEAEQDCPPVHESEDEVKLPAEPHVQPARMPASEESDLIDEASL